MISLFPIYDYIVVGIKNIFGWLYDIVVSRLPGASSLVLDMPSRTFDLTKIMTPEVMLLINEWFPLDFAIGCFISYCVIFVTVNLVNWILGFIPTLN